VAIAALGYSADTAQAGWFGPRSTAACVLFYVHHINQVNSCNGSAMMTAL